MRAVCGTLTPVGVLLLSVAVALLAARLHGGRFAALESLPIRGLLLLGGALFCQVFGVVLGYLGLPSGPTYAWALLISAVLVAVFIKVNGALAGTELIAVGLLLNAVVVGLNGNMPVSRHAAERAGAGPGVVSGPRHEPADSATALPWLGEVIPVPLPLRPEVDSIGDLLIAAGMGQLVFSAVRPYRRRDPKRTTAKPAAATVAQPAAKTDPKPDSTSPGGPHVKVTPKVPPKELTSSE